MAGRRASVNARGACRPALLFRMDTHMRRSCFALPVLALLATSALSLPARAQISIGVTVTEAPPELPVYEQPPLPEPGYIWTPGYWAYGDQGYFWVPGTWVEPPQEGLLWTPGYWAWQGGRFLFNNGYWGSQVGYYGGVDYGYGYGGYGYEGGLWRNGAFSYNRSVNNFGGVHVTNVYERTVNRTTINRVSFNGGPGGINRAPRPEELAVAREHHIEATQVQMQHTQAARQDRSLLVSANHGRPPVTAVSRPGDFHPAGGAAPRPESAPGRPAGAPGLRPAPALRPQVSPPTQRQPERPEPRPSQAMPPLRTQPERQPIQRPPVERQPVERQPVERQQMAPRPAAPMAPRPMQAPPRAAPPQAPHPAPPAGHEPDRKPPG